MEGNGSKICGNAADIERFINSIFDDVDSEDSSHLLEEIGGRNSIVDYSHSEDVSQQAFHVSKPPIGTTATQA